jgi:hypothetical protein
MRCNRADITHEIRLRIISRERTSSYINALNANLAVEQDSLFKLFGSSFWGLCEKKYPKTEYHFNQIPLKVKHYLLKLLNQNGPQPFQTVLTHFCNQYQLQPAQMDFKLRSLVQDGSLLLSEDDVLSIGLTQSNE